MCFCFMIWDLKLSWPLFMSLWNIIVLVVFVPMTLMDVQQILPNSNTPKMNILESIQLVNKHTFNSYKLKYTHKWSSWSALNWPINIHLIIANSNTPQMFLECIQLTNMHTSNSYYKLKNTLINKLPRLHIIGQEI
jgi:hypothetical protein